MGKKKTAQKIDTETVDKFELVTDNTGAVDELINYGEIMATANIT